MERNYALDRLKGIAIIAVVLYHLNILEFGYLGVDIFFVISGYLTMAGIKNRQDKGRFCCFHYIKERIVRIMPLVFLAGLVCIIIGYMGMLPDDYENLSESIVASNVASNNILAAITTKNYWDVVNEYKPLMHLWYVGVLVEYYVIFTLYIGILSKIEKKTKKKLIWGG